MALVRIAMLLWKFSKRCKIVCELCTILDSNYWFLSFLRVIFYRIIVHIHSLHLFLSRFLREHSDKLCLIETRHHRIDVRIHLSLPHVVDSTLNFRLITIDLLFIFHHYSRCPILLIFLASWWEPLTLKVLSFHGILVRIYIRNEHIDQKRVPNEWATVLLIFTLLHQLCYFLKFSLS